ncbi:MAG: hypothetical protein AAF491_10190, partial [Verrucomicrobiota bacterium]
MPEATALDPPSSDAAVFRGKASFTQRLFAGLGRGFDRLIGCVSMVLGLAIVSAIPVLNLLSLGFLLEASARVARSGKLRSGFPGLSFFSRSGKVVLGIWVWTLPIRLVHSFWRDAELIEAGSRNSQNLRFVLALLIVLISLHVLAAVLRGGRLRHFFLPAPFLWFQWLSGRKPIPRPEDTGKFLIQTMRKVGHLFRLGFFGFLGGALWLALPVLILFLASSAKNEGLALLGSLFGGILLGIAILFVPFLQTRYAISSRFSQFFGMTEAKRLFRQ